MLSCFTFFLFSYISHMPHEHSLPPFFPLLYGFRQTENVYPYLFYSFLTFLRVHQPENILLFFNILFFIIAFYKFNYYSQISWKFSLFFCFISHFLKTTVFWKIFQSSRACLKNSFCKMCVTICGRFRLNEGGVVGCVN